MECCFARRYFQGYLGVPPFGFPEPLRSDIVLSREIPGSDGRVMFEGRPGAELPPYDFEAARNTLEEKWGAGNIRDVDVMSHCMYPDVFDDYKTKCREFGKVDMIDTRTFVSGMEVGGKKEVVVEMERVSRGASAKERWPTSDARSGRK